ncbi:hypothetical protein V5O48_018919 [Marasmius crinis-equi]|uniref:Uncharacterized protein n=1 Tax=Marasmius crinis-equi TaxID=585013 RepID=A0ABR3EJV5_9AGAR
MNPIDMLLQQDFAAFGEWVAENDIGKEQDLADIAEQIGEEIEAKHLAEEAVDYNKRQYRQSVTLCRGLKREVIQARWRISRARLQFELNEAERERERFLGYLRSSRAQLAHAQQKLVELKREHWDLRDRMAFENFV